MNKAHPSHKLRFSWYASTYDYMCENCCNTDQVPDGWGKLTEPCSKEPIKEQQISK